MDNVICSDGVRKKEGEEVYYTECPYCGATLDPGERCDCRESEVKKDVGERFDDSGSGKRYEAQRVFAEK